MTDRLTRTERERRWPNLRPRDAATLIVLDRTGPEPSVLMGKRHDSHKFMPGKFVFPGGRIEPGDRRMLAAGMLDEPHGRRPLRPRRAPHLQPQPRPRTGCDSRDLRGDRGDAGLG